jgi:hypothetical protein
MIQLSIQVNDISVVMQIYNQIQIQRSESETGAFTTISGAGPIILVSGQSEYTEQDPTGTSSHWYRSRYYSTSTGYGSSWSSPVLGQLGDLFYDPLFPEEPCYGTTVDQSVVDRIRIYIGDPLSLRREFGEDASSSVHEDGKTYELDHKGWPVSIYMNNQSYNTSNNPSVHGYKYLTFDEDIDLTYTVISGCPPNQTTTTYGFDVWYYSFRHSDCEIMRAYDSCPPPPPLTSATATSQHYMLQTAIDLLMMENWEDAIEDGAIVRDEGSYYSQEPGFRFRDDLLGKLRKMLDDAIKVSVFSDIQGVLID